MVSSPYFEFRREFADCTSDLYVSNAVLIPSNWLKPLPLDQNRIMEKIFDGKG